MRSPHRAFMTGPTDVICPRELSNWSLCSKVSVLQGLCAPRSLCSNVSVFQRLCVPRFLCSKVSVFQGFCVPRFPTGNLYSTVEEGFRPNSSNYGNGTNAITEFYASADYDEEYENELCSKTDVVRFGALVTPMVLSVVIVLSLVGNLLVLVILARYEHLRSLTNAFMMNLALSDLVFTCGLPFWVSYHLNGWSYGDLTCKAVSFLFYAGYYSSGIFLILMTLHRYLAVLHPLSHLLSGSSHSQGTWSAVVSLVVWTVSLLAAMPALIFTKVIISDVSWRLWGVYQQNILFIVTLLVVCVCYSQILVRLLRPRVRVRRQRSGGYRRSQRTARLVFGLVLVFFVGWAPYNVVIFLRTLVYKSQDGGDAGSAESSTTLWEECGTSNTLDYSFYVTRLLAFSYCCLNPLFYVFVGVKFRNHLKRLLKGCCHGVTVVNNNNFSVLNRSSRLTSQSSGEFSL
ncbi:chemokine XC receptor 1-like [Salvelinus namaycush]|uniref:Chemokine XC receptor 1-like n=1 Tax=Salvelinus namaycush TaxID=8040 RepID=A0A8U0QG98_SALNM|nr:chemokine XC receptor 1-like [Salvelinus namaycush]